MRSPGRFQRQPSSCWCSVYWSRRSWNTTRMMLCNLQRSQGRCFCFRTNAIILVCAWRRRLFQKHMSSSYLHHFTSDFRKFPNFPIVKHSNFIGLAWNEKTEIWCSLVERKYKPTHKESSVLWRNRSSFMVSEKRQKSLQYLQNWATDHKKI